MLSRFINYVVLLCIFSNVIFSADHSWHTVPYGDSYWPADADEDYSWHTAPHTDQSYPSVRVGASSGQSAPHAYPPVYPEQQMSGRQAHKNLIPTLQYMRLSEIIRRKNVNNHIQCLIDFLQSNIHNWHLPQEYIEGYLNPEPKRSADLFRVPQTEIDVLASTLHQSLICENHLQILNDGSTKEYLFEMEPNDNNSRGYIYYVTGQRRSKIEYFPFPLICKALIKGNYYIVHMVFIL